MAKQFLTSIDLKKNELQNARVQNLASAPSSPVTGQIYYDTGTNKLFWWNGSGWIDATGGALANDSVTNAILANMAVNTIKGRITAGTGDPEDLTGTQVKTILAIVPGDVAGFDTQVRTNRLDQMTAPTAAVPWNAQKITGLADPTAAQDAATKAYVDATAAGIDWKASVRAATTANIATLAGGAPSTLDGVALALNDRILVKDQTTGSQNGIYTVTTVGTGANGTWTRAADADSSAEMSSGVATFVSEGTVNADTGWTLTTNDPITLGTTALVFTQFTSLGQVTAGNGLTKTGSTIDVNPDGTTIEISADQVRIAAGAAGAGLTGGGGAALAVGAGTGIAVAADTVGVDRTGTNGAHVPLLYSATIGNGSSTSITVTHNLGQRWAVVQVVDATTGEQVECDVTLTSTTQVTLGFAVAPATNALRVIVYG